jgi:hypothetical protein
LYPTRWRVPWCPTLIEDRSEGLVVSGQVQGAACEAEEPIGDMGIALGGLDGGMSEQGLNHL